MSTPKWAPGTLYLPGALVVPRTALPTTPVALQNPGWESGDATGWDIDLTQTGTGFAGVRAKDPHDGVYIYALDGTSGAFNATVTALNKEQPACAPGTLITARMWIRRSSGGPSDGRLIIRWYDSGGIEISTVEGTLYTKGETWHDGVVSAVAPAGTASVRVGFKGQATGDGDIRFDTLRWNYDSAAPQQGLMYKAVQPKTGTSDNVEPVWPTVLGVQVIDNDVIWEAVSLTRLVWQARPILRSGGTEPVWPTVVGERVPDNTIAWETTSRRVEDENCPNTKVVIIMASKVFAVAGDIIRFSATANPLDWTTEQDAGYLPSGLQSANANDMAVLQQYRGNLVAFNASSFQNWQVDPDPAAMAILDQMEGIGSTWYKAAQPVANELLFLSQRGVRSVGIAAGAENLAAGDVGEPVDELVQAAVIAMTGVRPLATYYPGAGQYWLAIRGPLPNGPAISGAAPNALGATPYSFTYTTTPGDSPIARTELIDTVLPSGWAWDELTATISHSGAPVPSGTITLKMRVYDEADLYANHVDEFRILDGIVRWDASTATGGGMAGGGTTTVTSTSITAGFITADASVSDGSWYWETTTGWYLVEGGLQNQSGQSGIIRKSDSAYGLILSQITDTDDGVNDGGAVSGGDALFEPVVMYEDWIPTEGVAHTARIRHHLTFSSGKATWRAAVDSGEWVEVMSDVSGTFAPYARSRGDTDPENPKGTTKDVTIYSRPADFMYAVPAGALPLGLAGVGE